MNLFACSKLRYTGLLIMFCMFCIASVDGAEISGTVYDYYGTTPVGGVSVQCLEYYGTDTTIYSAQTGPFGRFAVTVPAGVYIASVNPNGGTTQFIAQYHLGANSPYYTDALTVSDAEPLTGINFFLSTGYAVRGNLKTADNMAADGVLYAFDNTTGLYYWGMTGYSVDASTGGSFSLNLPQGVFSIIAYPLSTGPNAEIATVHVNDSMDGLILTLPSNAWIEGSVKTSSQLAVPSIRVDAIDSITGYSDGNGTTDSNGHYRIDNLIATRSYRILARTLFHPEYEFWTSPGTFYPSATNPSQAQLVTPSTSGIVNIDLTLPDAYGVIRGKVKDVNGSLVSGAYVFDFYISDVMNPFVSISQRATYTNDAGEYELTGIGPGRVGVAVIATNYVAQIYDEKNNTTTLKLASPIDVAAGQTVSNIDFLLEPTSALGTAPSVSSISPHFVFSGDTRQLTIKGANFNASAAIDLIDIYSPHRSGDMPTLSNVVISPDTVLISVSTGETTAKGPFYLTITNPDGQYTETGFHVILPLDHPEISILGAPSTFNSDSTLSVGWNVNNLTRTSVPVDVYLGLLLPTSDAVFYDNTTFTLEFKKMYDNYILSPGLFTVQDVIAEIPLGGAVLPSGDYLWFTGIAVPGTYDFIDVSLITIHTN